MYGLPVSNSGTSLAEWTEGLQKADSFDASGIAELSKAITKTPEFALAHAALAKQQMFHGFITESKSSLTKAQALRSNISDREVSAINILTATIELHDNALELALAHIENWPLDRFIFSLVVGPFGLFAFSQRSQWRENCLALMLKYQRYWPENDWWYSSALAFSKAECGLAEKAEELAVRTWEENNNGNCAHTLSHVYKEQNKTQEGVEFLSRWLDADSGSDMRHHLAWHLALLQFESGKVSHASMSELYQNEFDPTVADPMPLTTYSDNASFLWRCCLQGIRLEPTIVELTLEYGKQYYPELGFAFADMHRILLTALSGKQDEISGLETEISKTGQSNYLNVLLKGVLAFVDQDYQKTIAALESILDDTVRLGGSNPQRAIVVETLNTANRYV